MDQMPINWLAYGLAVVAQLVIGFIWFHPAVMGKVWARATGMSLDDMKPKNPAMVYGFTILYTLIFTFWLLINVTGPGQDVAPDGHSFHTFGHGVAHAILLTIAVIFPVLGTPALYEGKPKSWMMVQVLYWFLRMAVAQGIISMMR